MFRKTLPDVKRIVNPVQQMKVKLNDVKSSAISFPGIKANQRVLDLLGDISQRVPKSMDMQVTRMVIDPETVRISGETDTFNTVDNIKTGLEPSDYFSTVTITSANKVTIAGWSNGPPWCDSLGTSCCRCSISET